MPRPLPEDGLPGLDIDDVLHPMWSRPDHGLTDAPEHIRACYWELWAKLQAFDGRPNSECVVSYAANIWSLLSTEEAYQDQWWLVGQITARRVNPERNCPSQAPAIKGIANALIDTIVAKT